MDLTQAMKTFRKNGLHNGVKKTKIISANGIALKHVTKEMTSFAALR
jgi:translation elongation factor EF-Ts